MQKRNQIVDKILAERARHFNLPGSEWDAKRDPNDWLAIAGAYLFRATSTKNQKVEAGEFEDNCVKAAAVILAAIEHIDNMKDNDKLK